MDSNLIYFGLKLNEYSQLMRRIHSDKLLFPDLSKKENCKWYLDHLTLFHCNSFNEKGKEQENECICNALQKEFDEQKGRLYIIKIVGYGISDKAFALKCEVVRPIPIKNKIPHITVCTFNGGKPFESNNIKNWYQFKENDYIYITGYMIKVVKDVNLKK